MNKRQQYISNKIPELIKEGYKQPQAVAIAISMAEKKRRAQQGAMQQQAPQQGGEQQMQQIMQKIAEMLQQGAQPQDVLNQLVQAGIPQEQATQLIQAVMQQIPMQEEQPAMQQGGALPYYRQQGGEQNDIIQQVTEFLSQGGDVNQAVQFLVSKGGMDANQAMQLIEQISGGGGGGNPQEQMQSGGMYNSFAQKKNPTTEINRRYAQQALGGGVDYEQGYNSMVYPQSQAFIPYSTEYLQNQKPSPQYQGVFGESGVPYSGMESPTNIEPKSATFDLKGVGNIDNVKAINGLQTQYTGNKQKQQEENKKTYYNDKIFNPYGTPDWASYAGLGFGAKSPFNAAVGTAGFVLNSARNFLGGYASGKASREFAKEAGDRRFANNDTYQNTGGYGTNYTYGQQGGKIADVIAQNAVTENPNGNVNAEGGEFIKQPNGVFQPIVGEKHLKKDKLAEGTNIKAEKGAEMLSDYIELTPQHISEINKTYSLNLKGKHTPADILKKYNTKIGVTKLEKEKADLLIRTEKALKITDETTRNLSVNTLQKQTKKIDEKLNALKEVAVDFGDFVFDLQETIPKKGDGTQLYDSKGREVEGSGGEMAQQGRIVELAKKHNIPYERAIEVISMQQGGSWENQLNKNYPYGREAETKYVSGAFEEPNYGLESISEIAKRFKFLADQRGIDYSKLDLTTRKGVDTLAGLTQQFDKKNTPNLEQDYGINIGLTRKGIEYFLTTPTFKKLEKNNPAIALKLKNAKRGTYDVNNFTKEDRDVVMNEIKNSGDTSFADKNYLDNEAYFRGIDKQTIYFKDKEDFEKYKKEKGKAIDGYYKTDKKGVYVKPILLQPKEFENEKQKQEWIAKYGQNKEGLHQNFLAEDPNSDTYYTPFSPEQPATPTPTPTQKETPKEYDLLTPQKQNIEFKNRWILPNTPNPIRLAPSPIQPIAFNQVHFQNYEPIRDTGENIVAEQASQTYTANDKIEQMGMSPQQTAAVIGQNLATSQKSVSDVMGQVERANRADLQKAELYNLGQRAKEDLTNIDLRSKYQDQAMASLDNQERAWRRYYNEGNAIEAHNQLVNNQNKYYAALNNGNFNTLGNDIEFRDTPNISIKGSLPEITEEDYKNMSPEEARRTKRMVAMIKQRQIASQFS